MRLGGGGYRGEDRGKDDSERRRSMWAGAFCGSGPPGAGTPRAFVVHRDLYSFIHIHIHSYPFISIHIHPYTSIYTPAHTSPGPSALEDSFSAGPEHGVSPKRTFVMLPAPPQPRHWDQWQERTISCLLVSVSTPGGAWNRSKSSRTETELMETCTCFCQFFFCSGRVAPVPDPAWGQDWHHWRGNRPFSPWILVTQLGRVWVHHQSVFKKLHRRSLALKLFCSVQGSVYGDFGTHFSDAPRPSPAV